MLKVDTSLRDSEAISAFAAIVLYGKKDQVRYAVQHPVLENNQLGAGSPITHAGLQQSLLSLAQSQGGLTGQDFLPDNVLRYTPALLAWWRKPGKRTVYFRRDGEYSFTCQHPGLIFVATAAGLSICAVKGRNRPQYGEQVFHAPYMNVWEGGKLCSGNVQMPDSTLSNRIAAWEDAFFNSYFTHPNGTGLVKFKGDMIGLWEHMRQQPEKFPTSALVPLKMTAGQFCERGTP
ncbi:PRTRC system protein B [Gulbenkiania mobilis]|uniref:PRTRC system protein B n=1 Tax=Gulbenkiania mobilis TaxID=397457 RepID=UPI0006BBA855|nr:PRTRC system protein B [Gulbenkiania mobilis]